MLIALSVECLLFAGQRRRDKGRCLIQSARTLNFMSPSTKICTEHACLDFDEANKCPKSISLECDTDSCVAEKPSLGIRFRSLLIPPSERVSPAFGEFRYSCQLLCGGNVVLVSMH